MFRILTIGAVAFAPRGTLPPPPCGEVEICDPRSGKQISGGGRANWPISEHGSCARMPRMPNGGYGVRSACSKWKDCIFDARRRWVGTRSTSSVTAQSWLWNSTAGSIAERRLTTTRKEQNSCARGATAFCAFGIWKCAQSPERGGCDFCGREITPTRNLLPHV